MEHRSGFAALVHLFSNPSYRAFAIGTVFSNIGTWVQRVAIGWLTWRLTESGAWLGTIAFADLFPTMILAPLAGAMADRVDRLRAVQITQSLSLVQALTLAILTWNDVITVHLLLALALAQGVFVAFNQPVRQALIYNIVDAEDLSSAISFNSMIFNVARFIGPAIAGFVVVWGGEAPAFAFNALSFAIIVVALCFVKQIRPDERRRGRSVAEIPHEIVGGFRYAATHTGIGALFLLMIVFGAGARGFTELLPGFAAEVFGRGADGLAMMQSAVGIGALLAGLWLSQRGRIAGLTGIWFFAALCLPIGLLIFTATQHFTIALACMGIAGYFSASMGISQQTLVQAAVAGEMRGRVLGLYGMLMRGGPAFGALIMGLASEWVGLRWPVAGGALLCILWWVWTIRRKPRIAAALETQP